MHAQLEQLLHQESLTAANALVINWLDPKHRSFDLFDDPFSREIWKKRYQPQKPLVESNIYGTFHRVAKAISINEPVWNSTFYALMANGIFMPAGRILTSAGIDNVKSTLQNCYVMGTLEDSIEGIHKCFGESMVTLSRFGGVGIDFSPLRPRGAVIGNQGLKALGAVHWMTAWHEGSERIKQAGHRRGAKMATLRDSHPDIMEFISSKDKEGSLTSFNISVLISDRFIEAIEKDEPWDLWHERPKAGSSLNYKGEVFEGKTRYVWETVSARALWDAIMRHTYEFAEPGVIFIDRVNKENNLWYCEDIRCTNPCGEQPLPPYGACNLGHINLGRLVKYPFTNQAEFNFPLLEVAIEAAMNFLDMVIDVSNYPLPEQAEEQRTKRRIGLGITGLHDMLIQLNLPYGSREARQLVNRIMEVFALQAYMASYERGKTHGAFPLYNSSMWGETKDCFAARILNKYPQIMMGGKVPRNSLLLTVAPTGTTSTVYGNVSSGIEPVFAHHMKRKVWVDNAETETHDNESFISRFYKHCTGGEIEEITTAETALQIRPKDHVEMQSTVQKWIDASVTKTVNVPKDFSFEDFQHIYWDAYVGGCKGCTTYRPSDIRGSVLEDASQPKSEVQQIKDVVAEVAGIPRRMLDHPDPEVNEAQENLIKDFLQQTKRPDFLPGGTYKIKWPHLNDNIFLTINERDGKPWEAFLATRDLRNVEWMVLSMIQFSRALQRGQNPLLECEILIDVQGAHEGAFMDGKYYTSLISYIGTIMKQHFERMEVSATENTTAARPPPHPGPSEPTAEQGVHIGKYRLGPLCPKCQGVCFYEEGCVKCTQCDYSKCS